jgi:hypothetical protein
MAAAGGPFLAAVVLLAGAAVAKLARPGAAADAIVAVAGHPVPAATLVVRVIAVVELGLATGAFAWGGRLPTALVAASYLAFAAFALGARGRAASCGCFGGDTAPPSLLHAAVTTGFAGVAGWALLADPDPAARALADQPGAAAVLLAAAAVTAWLAWAVMTVLPRPVEA